MKVDLPDDWRIHPTFYVGKVKRHLPRFIDGEDVPSDVEQCPDTPRASPAPRHDKSRHKDAETPHERSSAYPAYPPAPVAGQQTLLRQQPPPPAHATPPSVVASGSVSAPSDAGPLPSTPMGHLHLALDSCQSFKQGIVLQSCHAIPLHLPLNRSQASGHSIMQRRARLKSYQTPQHVAGDTSVRICHTTS
ncbi:hypothetical protein H257_05748 [Aphanomyces astaci]|uniref:Uncharacterized protein n=1 Tax=Aphanomyces astaci TaxID=112090 RepID=W4GPA2_APHAT|nr:hypothetical protein H257_05748 [Aphanomyces astaci]ETV81161.1 hypothetical protein H257_05748 [Aphanomyces astaci]|eukprot:XP_009829019.1 hypothetical protein H257_05748 [Aphanomyces astaci]